MDDLIRYTDEKTALLTLLFAQELGMKSIGVVFAKEDKKNKELFSALQEQVKLALKKGLLCQNQKDVQRAKGKYDFLIGPCTRELVEFPGIEYLYAAELLEDKDKTHRRGSGMNQVIAKLLAEKGKTYIFDASSLFTDTGKILGRMGQNKKILRKQDCSLACYSLASEPYELRLAKERKHFLEYL